MSFQKKKFCKNDWEKIADDASSSASACDFRFTAGARLRVFHDQGRQFVLFNQRFSSEFSQEVSYGSIGYITIWTKLWLRVQIQ